YTDWDSFRELIERRLKLQIALKTPEDIEVAATHFTNLIQVACWLTTPDKPPKTPRHNCVPLEIRSKIQEKRRLRRVWHCGRHNEDKKALNKAIATSNFNQPKRTRPPLRLADAKWARTAQQRVDAFANHLAEVFKPNDGTGADRAEVAEAAAAVAAAGVVAVAAAALASPSTLAVPRFADLHAARHGIQFLCRV
ncbi:Uncharacterized protein OBRU01_16523, partial [Operophtera brumata]